MRNEGGGFAAIDDEVAAVLAFVISHTTFLTAQDDEMHRTTPAEPRTLNPEPNESKVKRGCEEMRIHFFTAPSHTV